MCSAKTNKTGGGVATGSAPSLTTRQVRDKRLRDMLKQMDDASLEPQLVRLGDASIASPFTSRHSSISCSESLSLSTKSARCS